MNLREEFSLRTVRKKVIAVSKAAGCLLILSYVASKRLPVGEEAAFLLWILFVACLILAVDLLLGLFISQPIERLGEAAERMAGLEFTVPCQIKSKDEFGTLSKNLNRMAGKLKDSLEKLERANESLKEEVEKEKRLLLERRELVDNLSHEMKTPLGIIQAYAEGLQEETDEEKKQKYAEVILSETERMNRLINTLLDLSALESGAALLKPERFDFVEFVETVAGRILLDAPDGDFRLQYQLPDRKVYVCTDRMRMEQVLNNLLINAKRNTEPGGVLRLSLLEKEGMLYFSVYNQGTLLSKESQSKIWTKFYRDKASKYQGSGLGLAIVSQILSMQELSYGAKNREEGVEFYFSIPTAD